MPSLNLMQLIGNCGKDVEMRFTPSGSPVATFSVAVNHTYTDSSGEKKQETEWFNCVCWNRLAETVNQYLGKGQNVYVSGRLKTRSWVSDDGQKHYRTELIASRVLFLEKRRTQNGSEEGEPISGEPAGEGTIEPSDIPF
jgi:single-strand DNA-binding protein